MLDLPSKRGELEKWMNKRDALMERKAKKGTLYQPHYSDSEDSDNTCEHRDYPDSDAESIETEFSEF